MIAGPNIVTIDLSALIRNLGQVKDIIGRDVRIMGVVKSDAYGHGLLGIGRALEKNGVDCLGVAYLHEALALRTGGVRLPVVILCGIHTREESRQVLAKGLTPVIYDLEVAEILAQECRRQGRKIRAQLKVDTGMGRLGVPWNQLGPFLERMISFKNLEIEALVSHLASADEADPRFSELQVERFEKAISMGRSYALPLKRNSMANSAGLMVSKKTHFDMVRPGIMLYGGLPSPDFVSPVPLASVMGLSAQVVQVRDLPDRTPVSYGRTYVTQGPRTIAVISAGYGEGLPRALSNRGKVLIGGQERDIVGRVCMNLTACDITGHHGVTRGDEAVFLGTQGGSCIRGDDMAGCAGTISYEVFCAIGGKNIRKYVT